MPELVKLPLRQTPLAGFNHTICNPFDACTTIHQADENPLQQLRYSQSRIVHLERLPKSNVNDSLSLSLRVVL